MTPIRSLRCIAAVAAAAFAGTVFAGEVRPQVPVIASPAVGSGFGTGSGVPQHARDSSNNVEFIGCSVIRGAVVVPEGVVPTPFPGPNQAVRCSARNAGRQTVACSTTDPLVVELMASVLASVTADSRVAFFFDASGTCTHLEVGMHSQLLRRSER